MSEGDNLQHREAGGSVVATRNDRSKLQSNVEAVTTMYRKLSEAAGRQVETEDVPALAWYWRGQQTAFELAATRLAEVSKATVGTKPPDEDAFVNTFKQVMELITSASSPGERERKSV